MGRTVPGWDSRRARSLRARGFTLLEILVCLLIFSIVMLATLDFFDASSAFAAAQVGRSEMQQALRIAQHDVLSSIRAAGRGGLRHATASPTTIGAAVEIRRNVPSGTHVLVGDPRSPRVRAGSDVLSIRGALDLPLYLVDARDDASFHLSTEADTGSVTVRSVTPLLGTAQSIGDLVELVGDPDLPPTAIVMESAHDVDVWGVARLRRGGSRARDSDGDGAVDEVTLAFDYLDGDDPIDHDTPESPFASAMAFSALSSGGSFPEERLLARGVRMLGILREVRYYVRETPASEDDPTERSAASLSRAEVYPNTEIAVGRSASSRARNLGIDIADHVFDLQIALACDPDGDGVVSESADGSDDDWQGNSLADAGGCIEATDVAALRSTILALAPQSGRGVLAPLLVRIEDHDYSGEPLNSGELRRHRRTLLRTRVDMRNLR